jgi:AcrR family transcriptional regulator
MKPKQADILRHASALFNREGYQSPSIERIAEHAGISKMTFYRYYADKEALILAILKQKRANLCRIWRRSPRIKPPRGKAVCRVRLLPSLVYLRNVPRLHVYPRAV